MFVGAMIAALFVCSFVGCTTDFPAEQPQKTPDDAAKLTNSRIDSTKNEGGNGSFTGDTEYADTLDLNINKEHEIRSTLSWQRNKTL